MNTFDLWMVVLLTCGCNLSGKCEEGEVCCLNFCWGT